MEKQTSRSQLINELAKSSHGKLLDYVATTQQAVQDEPEFLAHLISWNHDKGQIRDSKVALPMLSLSGGYEFHDDFVQNSLAHLAMLSPRHLLQAWKLAREVKTPNRGLDIKRLIEQYLRHRESNVALWNRTVVQHRKAMHELYRVAHVKPAVWADAIIFKGQYPAGSVFQQIKDLGNMSSLEAASVIITRRLPFVLLPPILGKKLKSADLLMAMIERMTPVELVNNTKMLIKLGVKDFPAARAAYEEGLSRAAKSGRQVAKTVTAIEAVDDEVMKAKLQKVQEKQLVKAGVEGRWLVLADKSQSMEKAIEVSRLVGASLAAAVAGKEVYLVFFDEGPTPMNITGLGYDQILKATQHVRAGGWTSIGCGVSYLLHKKLEVDGIVVVTDGQENKPPAFAVAYIEYCKFIGRRIPVYIYWVAGTPQHNTLAPNNDYMQVEYTQFDLRNQTIDQYSIPNLISTMRTSRYSLVEEIMSYPLLTLDDVFKTKETQHAGQTTCV